VRHLISEPLSVSAAENRLDGGFAAAAPREPTSRKAWVLVARRARLEWVAEDAKL